MVWGSSQMTRYLKTGQRSPVNLIHNGKDLACHCPDDRPCHRDVLIDLAQPADDPYAGGHALGITVARPWASLTLLPEQLSPIMIHHRSWETDYRGVLCIMAGHRLDERGAAAAPDSTPAGMRPKPDGWVLPCSSTSTPPGAAAAHPGASPADTATNVSTTGCSPTEHA